jgi:hypothetical protein
MGFRAVIKGVPFHEQDGVSGRCIHACIRGASLLLAHNFGTPPLTFADISQKAGVADGSEGLTLGEMIQALESTGFNVKSYEQATNGVVLDHITYSYIESGFPAILVIETEGAVYHALLVVGHEFDPHAWWPEAGPAYYYGGRDWLSSAMWLGYLIAHDDNFGPYMNVRRSIARRFAKAVVIPVPSMIPMAFDPLTAEGLAAKVVTGMETPLRFTSRSDWKLSLLTKEGMAKPVLRTLLLPEEVAREHLEKSDYPSEIKGAYRNTPLPGWVYFVEVSIATMYGSQLKLGEVILDPAIDVEADPDRRGEAVLVVHLPGLYWVSPITSDSAPLPVDTDGPSHLYARQTFAEMNKEP